MLQKNGIVKVYWDDEKQVNSEEYENLTEEELALMLEDESVEIVSQDKTKVGEIQVPPTPEEMMAAQQTGRDARAAHRGCLCLRCEGSQG